MEQARRIDRLTLIVVLVYVVGYAFLYGLVYQCASVCAEIKTLRSPSCVTDQLIYTQMSINRECGCFRPWTRGKSIGNTRFAPHAGTAWRLLTTEKWAEQHENKFMGEGTPVDAKTW